MTIPMLTGMVFVITWETFHEKISLNSVLLLPLVNFVNGFRLELMYSSLIVNIRWSVTRLHGFQLLVLLPQFIEITFFVCTNTINLLNLNSDRLVINLPNLHMIIKQKSPPLPQNLAPGIVFSTEVNLLYLLYSTTWSVVFCIW